MIGPCPCCGATLKVDGIGRHGFRCPRCLHWLELSGDGMALSPATTAAASKALNRSARGFWGALLAAIFGGPRSALPPLGSHLALPNVNPPAPENIRPPIAPKAPPPPPCRCRRGCRR